MEKLDAQSLKLHSEMEQALSKLRDEEREERTTALKVSTEKWQKILEECSKESLQEQERLIAEASKDRTNALREARERHEEEQAARDKAALRAQQAAVERVKEAAQENLEQMRQQLEETHQKQLEARLGEIRAREESALIRAESDKQRQLAVAKREANDLLEQTTQRMRKEHEAALAACAREAADETASEVARVRREEQGKFEAVLAQFTREREQSERQLVADHNAAMDQKLSEAALQLQEAVLKCRRQTEESMGRQMDQLVRDRDHMMNGAEESMKQVASERDEMQGRLEETRELLEEAEDMNFDLQRQVDSMQRAGAVLQLRTRLQYAKSVSSFCKFRKELTDSMEDKMAKANAKLQARLDKMEKQLERSDKKIEAHEEKQRSIKEVLTNYKRNDLMQCKVQSALIQDDLKQLAEAKAAAQKQHSDFSRDLAAIQGQVRELESQMQELSKVSAIQDGQINVTHAKRKRRLDQEFEHLLDRAQHRKTALEAVGTKIANIDEQVQVKEGQLKDLEAELVQILVEQQKKLIALLHTN